MAPTLLPQRVGWGQKLSYEQPTLTPFETGDCLVPNLGETIH